MLFLSGKQNITLTQYERSVFGFNPPPESSCSWILLTVDSKIPTVIQFFFQSQIDLHTVEFPTKYSPEN